MRFNLFLPYEILSLKDTFLVGDTPIASASKLDFSFLSYNHKKKHPDLLAYLQYLNCHFLPHARNSVYRAFDQVLNSIFEQF